MYSIMPMVHVFTLVSAQVGVLRVAACHCRPTVRALERWHGGNVGRFLYAVSLATGVKMMSVLE